MQLLTKPLQKGKDTARSIKEIALLLKNCPAKIESAVYSCLQLHADTKRSARRRTRSGGPRTARTGAERRHRTFEPCQGSKKERYRFGIVLFSSARRGSNPRPPPWQGGAPPLSHSRMSYGQVIIYYRVPEMSTKKVCIFFVNCIYN